MLRVRGGDYLKIHQTEQGERIGYTQLEGLGDEQLAAPPRYALIRPDTGQVISAHDLKHYAEWALEPYQDVAFAEAMRLDAQHLPAIPEQPEKRRADDLQQKPVDDPNHSPNKHSGSEHSDEWRDAVLPETPASEIALETEEPHRQETKAAIVYRSIGTAGWRKVAEMRVADFAEVQEIVHKTRPDLDVRVTRNDPVPIQEADVIQFGGEARAVGEAGRLEPAPVAFAEWMRTHGRSKDREPEFEP
jgi:hypothetical protein